MCRLPHLLDEDKCHEELRRMRWRHGTRCPGRASNRVFTRGRHDRPPACQRCLCGNCGKRFDDLTGTIFAGRHPPLAVWLAFLYLMGLNLSNRQIALELGLNEGDGRRGRALLGALIDTLLQPEPCPQNTI
ncbi:transposase [Methylomagnum sp.]